MMATVSGYKTKAGQRYKVRYMKPDGTQGSKAGFPSKPAAEGWAAKLEVRKIEGDFVDPRYGKLTVGSFAEGWLALKKMKLKPSAYTPLESAWRIHVEPEWGGVALRDIEISAIEDWISVMMIEVRDPDDPDVVLKPASGATTVIRAHSVLSGVLDRAVRDGKLATNKAREVENLPKKRPKRKIYLTHEKVTTMAENSGRWATLILLLSYCGLRWGEAVGLTVDDLDLLRRRVKIRRNAVQVGAAFAVGSPKSNKDRSVPIPRFLVDDLSAACVGKARTALVFPGPDGTHLRRPNSQRGWFVSAARKAGEPDLTPHDLRHTAASLAVSAGANVKAIQRMLGHESAALTLDVYAELFDDDLDSVADALDRARTAAV